MIEIEKLEMLAKAAQRGEVSWSFGPSQTLELIAEVRRLSGIVEKYIDPKEVRLTGMHPIGGALHIGLEGGACKIFAESFAEQFRESGATNYVEMTLESNDAEIGELLVTLQRVQGKTPAQLRREAEAERNALRDDAERLRAELHDFTTTYGDLNQEVAGLRADAERYRRLKTFAHPSYNVKAISNAHSASLAKEEFLTVYAGSWEAMDAVLDGVVTVNTVNIKEQS